eukprot:scaffold89346_cov44-Prasinocladus_malaysianus.AAC.1
MTVRLLLDNNDVSIPYVLSGQDNVRLLACTIVGGQTPARCIDVLDGMTSCRSWRQRASAGVCCAATGRCPIWTPIG